MEFSHGRKARKNPWTLDLNKFTRPGLFFNWLPETSGASRTIVSCSVYARSLSRFTCLWMSSSVLNGAFLREVYERRLIRVVFLYFIYFPESVRNKESKPSTPQRNNAVPKKCTYGTKTPSPKCCPKSCFYIFHIISTLPSNLSISFLVIGSFPSFVSIFQPSFSASCTVIGRYQEIS